MRLFLVDSGYSLSRVRWAAAFGLTLAAWMLTACSGDAWLGDEDEEVLPGRRIAVLRSEAELRADPGAAQAISVALPSPLHNKAWPQAGGTSSSVVGQLVAPALKSGASGIRTERIEAGAGYAFDGPLVASPVIGGDTLFSMDGRGVVTARNMDDRRLIWTYKPAKHKQSAPLVGGGLGYSGDTLFMTLGDGRVIALDAKGGAQRWERDVELPLRAPPRIHHGRVFVTTLASQLFALDAGSGRMLWKHRGVRRSAAILGGAVPAAKDDTVVVTYASGEVYALDAASGRELWHDLLMRPSHTTQTLSITDIVGNPVIADGRVYVVGHGGLFVAVDLESGRRIWERDISSVHTPWIAGDFLFVLAENSLLCIHAADGAILWVTSLQDADKDTVSGAWTDPVLTGGRVHLINAGGLLYSILPENGGVVERGPAPAGLYGPPAAATGALFLPRQSGQILVLRDRD